EKKRRSGIATELLGFVFRELSAEGGESLSLEVASRNEGAVRFYENLGFQEVGRRRGFYRNPTDDALVMMKSV
ncbi:MAG: GNAT family N-acetyltransferase, partial [Clostridia bacterium]|nr:GNAT family N-acetyltransferase [Clostridia bacterium]